MIKHLYNIEAMHNTCVAFGSFDGMHKGHLAIAGQTVKAAKDHKCRSVVISIYSAAEAGQEKVLTTEEEKAYYLEKAGIEVMVSCNIDTQAAKREELIRELVIRKTGAEVIVTGEENQDLEFIRKITAEQNIELIVVSAVRYENEIITTEKIRAAFEGCRFEEVTEMCGHPYVMIGEVEHGKALGRTVGMPTANLGVADTKLKPPSGVYATLSEIEGETFQGLTNIGTRPSVDNMSYITVETFLLDFNRDIYGMKIIMEVHLYIRGVKKFNNLKEVQGQVQKDLEKVKGYLDTTTKMAI